MLEAAQDYALRAGLASDGIRQGCKSRSWERDMRFDIILKTRTTNNVDRAELGSGYSLFESHT